MALTCAAALILSLAPAAAPASTPTPAPASTSAPTPAVATGESARGEVVPAQGSAFAQVPPEEDEVESNFATLLRTLLVLAIVLGIVYVSLNYGLRKLMGVRGLPTGRSSLVKVIERIPLDPKRSLFVVHAAGEYLLIGGGDDGLNLLGKLDTAEVERVLDQQLKSAPQMSPFLQKLLSRKGGTPPANKV